MLKMARQSVNIKNTGAMDGDEVTQIYVSKLNDADAPIRHLVAFKRIHIKTGAEKTVQFQLDTDAFATYSEDGKKQILPGEYEVSIGGGQPLQNTAFQITTIKII